MKRLLFCSVISLFSLHTLAQVPYQTLDSLCSIIRNFQLNTEGKSYPDEAGSYVLSFSGDNFNVLSYNRLAYHSVYKSSGGKELLYVTEDIDLSKAKAVVLPRFKQGLGPIKLWFPEGYLKTKVYDQGKVVKTLSPDYLEFFTTNDRGSATDRKNFTYWKQYKTLAHLCHLMQIEKGIIDEKYINEVNKRFDECLDHPSSENYLFSEKFLADYKSRTIKPLYWEEIKEDYGYYLDEETKAFHFIDSLCTLYKFKANMTEEKFGRYNTEAYNKVFYRNVSPVNSSVSEWHTYSAAPTFRKAGAGPWSMSVSEGIVSTYTYILEYSFKNRYKTQGFYDSLIRELKAKVPARYIKTSAEEPNSIYIYSDSSPVALEFMYDLSEGNSHAGRGTYVLLEFTTVQVTLLSLKKSKSYKTGLGN